VILRSSGEPEEAWEGGWIEELGKIARNPTGITNYYIEPKVPIMVEPFVPVVAPVPARAPIIVVSNILSPHNQ
jgi:hypothetical protein